MDEYQRATAAVAEERAALTVTAVADVGELTGDFIMCSATVSVLLPQGTPAGTPPSRLRQP